MVPALQPKVKQLVNFARGRAWFSPPFGASIMKSFTGDETAENCESLQLILSEVVKHRKLCV